MLSTLSLKQTVKTVFLTVCSFKPSHRPIYFGVKGLGMLTKKTWEHICFCLYCAVVRATSIKSGHQLYLSEGHILF